MLHQFFPYLFPKFWLVLKLKIFSGLHLYHSTLSSLPFSWGDCSFAPATPPIYWFSLLLHQCANKQSWWCHTCFSYLEKRAKLDKWVYAKQLAQLHFIYYRAKENHYHDMTKDLWRDFNWPLQDTISTCFSIQAKTFSVGWTVNTVLTPWNQWKSEVAKSNVQLYGVNNDGFTFVQLKANFKGIQILCWDYFMLCWKAVKQRGRSAAQKPTLICMGNLGWQTVITWGQIWLRHRD